VKLPSLSQYILDHLRLCLHCGARFVGDDWRDRYCCETCAHEGKKRAKLDWWNKNRRSNE
jgi:hypothetical protein